MLRVALTAAALALLGPGLASAQTERLNSEKGTVEVQSITQSLENPWGMAFLPDGKRLLVTERPGRLRLVGLDGQLSAPLGGVPKVYARGQGGLLDVALSPDFAADRLVYLTWAEQGIDGKAGTSAGRGRLSDDSSRLENFEVIFQQQPKLSEGLHFGSRLVFSGDYLFIALGDNNARAEAQNLASHQGTVVRLHHDGSVPPDNPFVERAGARPEIWAYGLRNQQGAAINPWTGELWTVDHGPRGGDEINRPRAGENYGWPLATHGINYSGLRIPEAKGEWVEGSVRPHHVWPRSPAVSGMAFYDAERFPAWQRSLFIGALADRSLIRLELDGERIAHEERLLKERNRRIRAVQVGPDGFLYMLTDDARGELLRVGLAP